VRKTFSDSTGNFNRLMPSFLVDEHTLLGVWQEHSPLSTFAILQGVIVYKYTSSLRLV
jgi:hypothetical protein